MKSFIKSHRRGGSNPPETEGGSLSTPRLHHTSSSFSLRPKTPNSSPTLFNSSVFNLSPPPSLSAEAKNMSPVSSPTAPAFPENNGKRSILKGFLKHKSSKSSLNNNTGPISPVITGKSFVTFSDATLTLPSQTPEFVVDRPHALKPNRDKTPASTQNKRFYKTDTDSVISGSTTPSLNENVPLENKLNCESTNSSAGLERFLVVANPTSSSKSLQSSVSKGDEGSDSSSEFSFEANRTYGRSSSIKYYKNKADIDREETALMNKKYVENFVGEDVDIKDLLDDLNYDDSDLEDDTENLFNRKLFSSDEEDGGLDDLDELDELDELNDDDNYSEEVLEDGLDDTFNGNNDHYINENSFNEDFNNSADDNYEESFINEVNEKSSVEDNFDTTITSTNFQQEQNINSEHEANLNSTNSAISFDEEPFDPGHKESLDEHLDEHLNEHLNEDLKQDLKKDHTNNITKGEPTDKSSFVNNLSKRMSHMTVDSSNSPMPTLVMSMGAREKTRLGLNLRSRSLKYHQLSTNHDELQFLDSKHSWYDDEPLSNGQQTISFTTIKSEDDITRDKYIHHGVDRFDDSLLDEINEVPEDFEFNENDKEIKSNLSRNSLRRKANKFASLLIPSADTGIKFQKNDKTVTLFRSASVRSETGSFRNVEMEDNRATLDEDDMESLDLVTPVTSFERPGALMNSFDSPLTTISEGSFDSTNSPRM